MQLVIHKIEADVMDMIYDPYYDCMIDKMQLCAIEPYLYEETYLPVKNDWNKKGIWRLYSSGPYHHIEQLKIVLSEGVQEVLVRSAPIFMDQVDISITRLLCEKQIGDPDEWLDGDLQRDYSWEFFMRSNEQRRCEGGYITSYGPIRMLYVESMHPYVWDEIPNFENRLYIFLPFEKHPENCGYGYPQVDPTVNTMV